MPEPLTNVERSLELEEIDKNLYRSKELWKPVGARGTFGGQVIGLALNAAHRTVDPKFQVHSLHSYFLFAGDNTIPIIYKVQEVRTGKTYASRSVQASQRGKYIFSMMVSYAVPEPSTLDYQPKMPILPPPEQIKSMHEKLKDLLNEPKAAKFHKTIKMRLQQPFTVEMKQIPKRFFELEGQVSTKLFIWMKAVGKLPDDSTVHQCVLAFCSDFNLLNAALAPFGLASYSEQRYQSVKMMTSLDHSVWFHEDFRADEWLLYEIETSKSGKQRGFASGKVWSRDGRLVVSTAQEGVIRATLPPKL